MTADSNLDSLPKSWDPGAVEAEIYARWVAADFAGDPTSGKAGVFDRAAAAQCHGQPHMGHALTTP